MKIYLQNESAPHSPEEITKRIAAGSIDWNTPGAYDPAGPWLPLCQLGAFRITASEGAEAEPPKPAPHRREKTYQLVLAALAVFVPTLLVLTYLDTSLAGGVAGTIAVICMITTGLFLYFLPAYVAHRRNHHNLLAIFILNLLLGWSVLGWVAALVWSCTTAPSRAPLRDPALIL